MLILNASEVRKALPMKETIEAVKDAYASLSDGTAVVPLRTRLPIQSRDAVSLFMPAYMRTDLTEALAIKVVSLYPSNPPRGLAYIQAAVMVFDPETGHGMVLLEGSTLTAIRTGAGSGAAIDLLARKDSKTVAIFGAGPQGKTQLEAACTVRDIETAYIFDTSREKAEAYTRELAGRGRIPRDIRMREIALGKGAAAPTVTGTRFFLHAFHLGFRHPVSGDAMSFTVPDPPEFTAFLSAVRGTLRLPPRSGGHSLRFPVSRSEECPPPRAP